MKKSKIRLTINDFTNDIINWIEKHFDEKLTMDDLSSKIGYSKRMIQLHFKEQYGMSIGEYTLNRRIYRASALLRMTSLSVSEISHGLHYDNHHNFCRAFKKKMGYSPLTYRNLPIEELPTIPLPKMYHRHPITYEFAEFKNKTIDGENLLYNDEIRYSNVSGGIVRLRKIRSWFSNNQYPLAIASDVLSNSSLVLGRMGEVTVSAYIGELIDKFMLPQQNIIPCIDGMYLRCDFDGFFDDYITHNKEIYSHLINNLNLKRRDGCDVEIFHFTPHVFDETPKVICEHYIPIIRQ